MIHTLIPESGSGILCKLKRSLLLNEWKTNDQKQSDNEGKSTKKIDNPTERLPAVVTNEDNIKNASTLLDNSRMYSSDNRKPSGTNLVQNNTFQNAQLNNLSQFENQKYLLSKRKNIRDNSKRVTSFKTKKKRAPIKLGPSANYIQTLYNPKGIDGSFNNSLVDISQNKESAKNKLSSKNTMGSFKIPSCSSTIEISKINIKEKCVQTIKVGNSVTCIFRSIRKI